MKIKSASLILCIGAALMSQLALAAPCELEEGLLGQLVVGPDCEPFSYNQHELDDRFERIVAPRLIIKLPDLEPIDANFNVDALVPGVINVDVKIANLGEVRSNDFDVTATLEIRSSLTQPPIAIHSWTERYPGLDPQEEVRIGFPLESFSWQHGQRMTLSIVADSQHSPGGEIWESNERNNAGFESCRVDTGAIHQGRLCPDGPLTLSN